MTPDYLRLFQQNIKNPHVSGDHITGLCPFHDDQKQSFSSNLKTGLWICHANCSQGNAYQFAEKLGLDPKPYLTSKQQRNGDQTPKQPQTSPSITQQEQVKQFSRFLLDHWDYHALPGWNKAIVEQTLTGYDPQYHCLTFPIYDLQDNLINIIWHKNHRIKGVHGNHWFPLHFLKNHEFEYIVWCEGEKDCITLLSQGIPAITNTGGAGRIPEQLDYLKQYARIYLCFDQDTAGFRADLAVCQHLQLYQPTLHVFISRLPENDVTEWFQTKKTKQDFISEILDLSLEVQKGQQSPPLPIFRTWNDYVQDKSPEPKHIISKGILPQESLLILSGEPKVGKSHLAMNLAYHIVTGSSWFDFNIGITGKCLILQAENAYYAQRSRIQTIHNLTTPPYSLPTINNDQLLISDMIHSIKINTPEGQEALKQIISIHKPLVLIIDPLINFHTAEENSNTEMAQIMDFLHSLKTDFHLSLIIVHHERKPTGTDNSAGTALRGASAIRGGYDTGLALKHYYEKHTGRKLHQLDFELRNGPPIEPFYLELDQSCLTFNKVDIAVTIRDFIVEQLHRVKESGLLQTELTELAVEEEYSKSQTDRAVNALLHRKIIVTESKRNRTLWHRNYHAALPF